MHPGARVEAAIAAIGFFQTHAALLPGLAKLRGKIARNRRDQESRSDQ